MKKPEPTKPDQIMGIARENRPKPMAVARKGRKTPFDHRCDSFLRNYLVIPQMMANKRVGPEAVKAIYIVGCKPPQSEPDCLDFR